MRKKRKEREGFCPKIQLLPNYIEKVPVNDFKVIIGIMKGGDRAGKTAAVMKRCIHSSLATTIFKEKGRLGSGD